MVESSLGVVGACLPTMRPLFRNFSFKSIIRSIHKFAAIRTVHWRWSPSKGEKVDDAGFKPSTTNISVDFRANSQDIPASYRADRFDDLPDFPSLVDNRHSDRNDATAENLV